MRISIDEKALASRSSVHEKRTDSAISATVMAMS
jgi:hypothetical protein